jgi:hypothetical protein
VAECEGLLVDSAEFGPPGSLPVIVTDGALPATSGPLTYITDIESSGSGFFLESTEPSAATALTLRVAFSNPGSIPEPPFDLPPGYYPLLPYLAMAIVSAPGDMTSESLVAVTTVHEAPVGAVVEWIVDDPFGFTVAVLAGVTPMPAGDYDIEVTVTFASAVAPVALIAASAWGGEAMTLVSWSWDCIPPVPPTPAVPRSTVECLGAGAYSIDLVRRRTLLGPAGTMGVDDLGADLEVLSGSWGRALSATSSAGVDVAVSRECATLLQRVDCAVAELELWRYVGGRGNARNQLVWAGPVLDIIDNRDGTASISAKDSSYYMAEERMAKPRSWVDVEASTVFADLVAQALEEDDPGITLELTPTGIMVTRIIAPTDAKKLGGELAELERTAVDWTVTNRQWWVGGEQVSAVGRLPITLVDDMFDRPPKIRLARSAQATRAIVRGNGVVGVYGGPRDQDGVLIEKIQDDNNIVDQASADAAARTLWDRVHETPILVEGGSAKLSADCELDIMTLIPGVGIPVEVGDALVYRGMARLQSVDVRFGPGTEDVSVTTQPVGTGTV